MRKAGPSTRDMNAPITAEALGLEPVCGENPRPHHKADTYEAECLSAVVYHDRRLRAWKCRLEFRIVSDGGEVCAFFHLGRGDTPHAGPNSEYRRAWVLAAGTAPRKRQVLSSRIFKGKLFEIELGTVTKRADQSAHAKEAEYSVVRRILLRTYP